MEVKSDNFCSDTYVPTENDNNFERKKTTFALVRVHFFFIRKFFVLESEKERATSSHLHYNLHGNVFKLLLQIHGFKI